MSSGPVLETVLTDERKQCLHQPMTKNDLGPFTIEPADGWTECSCITDPCRHSPDRMREYRAWTVWDNEANHGRGEHAFVTRGSHFDIEYERKRDAVEAARDYLDAHRSVAS